MLCLVIQISCLLETSLRFSIALQNLECLDLKSNILYDFLCDSIYYYMYVNTCRNKKVIKIKKIKKEKKQKKKSFTVRTNKKTSKNARLYGTVKVIRRISTVSNAAL